MKVVIFGLTISSSWGNGHATLWRGLCRALARRGHDLVFFEHNLPYYGAHRDLWDLPGGTLVLFDDFGEIYRQARQHCDEADVAMVTSYCPDGIAATDLVLSSQAGVRAFYDLDTPVTLDRWRAGSVPYIGPDGLRQFDLVLSYTGGAALTELVHRLGAKRVAPLYGSVDPEVHRPEAIAQRYCSDLSYLGTYAEDRQASLETLLIKPARALPKRRFLIGGAQYPQSFPWNDNVFFVRHLPPAEHPAFFSSTRLTLNITRRAMAEMGYCPSGRLFEAAACAAPLLSDWWPGLDQFFEPGVEILVAHGTEDSIRALELSDRELATIARSARDRTLSEHTADRRVDELEAVLGATTLVPAQPAVVLAGN